MKELRRGLNGGTLKIMLLLVALVSIMLASTAMAASVTLSGAASGTYTLVDMTINSNGDITLNVSGGDTPPAPGALNLSLSPVTLPAGTVGSAYSTTVTMTASNGTSPYTYSCSGSGVAGITASNNGSTCTISGTPTVSGLYSVNFSVTDSAATPDTVSSSKSFSVSAPTDPSKCIDIGPRYPAYLDNQSIPAKGIVNYCFTIDRTVSAVVPYIRSRDWKTNSHMFVSNISNPTMDEINRVLATNSTINRTGSPPWYSFGSYSNERLVLSKSAKAGDKFYVTVYNSDSVSSLVQLYWEAF
jgi:hypothetical protein